MAVTTTVGHDTVTFFIIFMVALIVMKIFTHRLHSAAPLDCNCVA